ncbi:unnamed protein product [Polarella glacialis]|uniref:Cystathionine gamma-lyase n=1 Tax=Polarella glacialis TaxID=89957 RepID=A0A813JQ68_POLGL|nr:unnamed protein product [Polarella glacialis]
MLRRLFLAVESHSGSSRSPGSASSSFGAVQSKRHAASKPGAGLATSMQQHWRVKPSSDVPTPGWGLALPIIPSSTFKMMDAAHGARLHAKDRSPEADEDGYVYGRWGNPTTHAVGRMLSTAEGIDIEAEGSCTYVFSSGMAAITTTMLTLLTSGSHVVAQRCVYGGTHEVLSGILPALGVEVTWVDGSSIEQWSAAVRPNTRLLYAETPANPSMRLTDLEALGALCLQVNLSRPAPERLAVAVDGTFGTPFHQQALSYPGVDISIHSCTKYLGGHSDVVAGCVTTRDEGLLKRLGHFQKLLGNSLGPWEAYLLGRGMKSFVPRMRTHSANAQQIAEFLEAHPNVTAVHYPGLKSHPDHELAKKMLRNGFSGMISFELPSYAKAAQVCERVKCIHLAVSLGATESLIQHPASMTHAMVPEEERAAAGIPGGLVDSKATTTAATTTTTTNQHKKTTTTTTVQQQCFFFVVCGNLVPGGLVRLSVGTFVWPNHVIQITNYNKQQPNNNNSNKTTSKSQQTVIWNASRLAQRRPVISSPT